MSWVEDKNSCTNSFASSGLTSDVAPIWKESEKIPKKIKNEIILNLNTLLTLIHIIWGYCNDLKILYK